MDARVGGSVEGEEKSLTRSKVACFLVCEGEKKEIVFFEFAADYICLFCYISSKQISKQIN